jgi:hypothetical protein
MVCEEAVTAIVCLYGAGGVFKPEHVARWVRMVRKHAPGAPVVCITDTPAEVEHLVDEVQVLTDTERAWGWERSWQKLAMFKRPGPCLYLDLDVNVLGDLRPMLDLAAQHDLIMSRDFWKMDPPHVNASVVGWRGDLSGLYEKFAADPAAGMTKPFGCPWRHYGDGQWLALNADYIERWQWLLPGSVASFKNEALDPLRCLVAVSHGLPRPWDANGADAWLA